MFENFKKEINYQHLTINIEKIKEIAKSFNDLYIPSWEEEIFYLENLENEINFIFLINTINFSYWSDENKLKWYFIFNNQKYTGSFALFAALKAAINNGYPLFDPQYLKNISQKDLKDILEKFQEIPMFNQRLEIIKNIGTNLIDNQIKSFYDIYKNSNNSAISLIEKIRNLFPSFNDSFIFQEHRYNFLKRAQLIPSMIYGRFQEKNIEQFYDIDQLTVFADYRVPQTLRKLGLIDYDINLSEKIKNRIYLDSGSSEELEIRISTIYTSLLLKEFINQERKQNEINSLHIDYYLWKSGKSILEPDYDFHRTRTIFY